MDNQPNLMHTNQYSLSIRFSSDGFSLSVSDEDNKLISTKRINVDLLQLTEAEIIKQLSNQTEIKLAFKSIRLICELEKYTLIPSLVFDNKHAADLLYMEHSAEKNEIILVNDILPWDSALAFAIPSKLSNALDYFYPEIEIENHMSYFLTDVVKMQNENTIQIWVRAKTMDVVVLTNNRVRLINSYSYSSSEDFTYYALRIIEQLSISQDCKILLYNAAKRPELQNDVLKYIEQCETIN